MVQQVNVSQRSRSFYINYNNHDSSSVVMKNFHLHDDYEIYYLLEGDRLYLIEGKEYIVHENSMVFINKNVVHKTVTKNNAKHQRIVINFRQSFIQKGEQELLDFLFGQGPNIISVPPKRQNALIQLMTTLQEEYYINLTDSNDYIRSLLLQLIIESKRLIEQQNKEYPCKILENNHSYDNDFISEIIKYINTHFMHDLSLLHLSHRFHLSEYYISRLFKKLSGSNVINYINSVRVNEAQRLLVETNFKMTVIAGKIGFKNSVNFCRVFKKYNGISPTNYRNKYQLNVQLNN